jgi:hypothetical protein
LATSLGLRDLAQGHALEVLDQPDLAAPLETIGAFFIQAVAFGRERLVLPSGRGEVEAGDANAALAAQSFVWNRASLDQWLENPGQHVLGTAMTIRVGDAQDRADLIAFPRTLGDRRWAPRQRHPGLT